MTTLEEGFIPKGYKLAVVRPDGTVHDTIDLGGYEFIDGFAPMARGALILEIEAAVRRAL